MFFQSCILVTLPNLPLIRPSVSFYETNNLIKGVIAAVSGFGGVNGRHRQFGC